MQHHQQTTVIIEVIYVCKEQKGDKHRALWDPKFNWKPVRIVAIDDYLLESTDQKRTKPLQQLTSDA